MAWVKLDDGFAEHPKIARLSDSALALWVTGVAYCNRNLTDGFIPRMVGLGQLRYCDGNPVPFISELEEAELWDRVDGGWQVHDYLDFQPSRADVQAEREKTAERVRQHRSKKQPRNAVTPGGGNAVTPEVGNAVTNGERNGERNGVGNGGVTPAPVPDPVPPVIPLPPVEVSDRSELQQTLDELKAVLVDLFGEPPPSGWSVYQRVATWIRDQGGTSADVRDRAARIAAEWGPKAATVTSLEKHWNRYSAAVGQVTEADVERFADEQRREKRRLRALELDRTKGLPG